MGADTGRGKIETGISEKRQRRIREWRWAMKKGGEESQERHKWEWHK